MIFTGSGREYVLGEAHKMLEDLDSILARNIEGCTIDKLSISIANNATCKDGSRRPIRPTCSVAMHTDDNRYLRLSVGY